MGGIFKPRRGRLSRWLGYAFAAVMMLGLCGAGAVLGLNWWVDFSDEPEPADVIVILAGGYARPAYAAELYQKGVAPELWLSRPAPHPTEEPVRRLGIPLPLEEEINREILLRKGVPPSKIRLYGRQVMSTADEARYFGAEYGASGKRVLIVTSRYHARRAKLIFRRRLGGADVRVAATPHETHPREWVRDKFLAQSVVLEVFKTLYFLVGGRFLGKAPVG